MTVSDPPKSPLRRLTNLRIGFLKAGTEAPAHSPLFATLPSRRLFTPPSARPAHFRPPRAWENRCTVYRSSFPHRLDHPPV